MRKVLQYNYKVIRYMPSVIRRECVNIGLVMKDINAGRKLIRLTTQWECCIALDPQFNPQNLLITVLYPPGETVECMDEPGHMQPDEGVGAAMGIVQFSSIGGGIGCFMRSGEDLTTLEANFNSLFKELVERPQPKNNLS